MHEVTPHHKKRNMNLTIKFLLDNIRENVKFLLPSEVFCKIQVKLYIFNLKDEASKLLMCWCHLIKKEAIRNCLMLKSQLLYTKLANWDQAVRFANFITCQTPLSRSTNQILFRISYYRTPWTAWPIRFSQTHIQRDRQTLRSNLERLIDQGNGCLCEASKRNAEDW